MSQVALRFCCPACGGTQFEVLRTRRRRGYVGRTRICLACRKRVYSREQLLVEEKSGPNAKRGTPVYPPVGDRGFSPCNTASVR